MTTLTIEDDRLVVRGKITRPLLSDLRKVPMWKIRKDGSWAFAMPCRAAVVKICDEHGVQVDERARTPPLTVAEQIEKVAASRSLDADLVVPGMTGELRPFQRAGVSYASQERRCIIADEMGLGKTPQGLATLQVTQAFPAVIIVPSSIKLNWARETARWLPHLRVGAVYGIPSNRLGADVAARIRRMPTQSRHRVKPGEPIKITLDSDGDVDRVHRLLTDLDVIIVNYDILGPTVPSKRELQRRTPMEYGWTPILSALPLKAVVGDESHMMMNADTLRTRAAIELAESVAGDPVRLALSGSAVLNRRVELAAQLDFIGRLGEFGGRKTVQESPDIARQMRARCFVRRLKKDVAPELPKREHSPVVLGREVLDKAVMRDYDRAEADTLQFLADKARAVAAELGEDPESAAVAAVMRAAGKEVLIRINILRKLAMQAKLPAAERWITEFGKTGGKLLVFGDHLEGLDRFSKTFSAPIIKGAVKTERRMKIVDDFQDPNGAQFVFLQIKAGGVGLTMTAASNVLFIEQAWSPLLHDQAIDRCYGRLNDMHGAVGWYLIAEGTIDEWIRDLLARKRIECDDALDGDITPDDVEATSVYGDLVERMYRRALAVSRRT